MCVCPSTLLTSFQCRTEVVRFRDFFFKWEKFGQNTLSCFFFSLSYFLFLKAPLAGQWVERLCCPSRQSTLHFSRPAGYKSFWKHSGFDHFDWYSLCPTWGIKSSLPAIPGKGPVSGVTSLLLSIPCSRSPALRALVPQVSPAAPALCGEQPACPSRSRAVGQPVLGGLRSFSALEQRRQLAAAAGQWYFPEKARGIFYIVFS